MASTKRRLSVLQSRSDSRQYASSNFRGVSLICFSAVMVVLIFFRLNVCPSNRGNLKALWHKPC